MKAKKLLTFLCLVSLVGCGNTATSTSSNSTNSTSSSLSETSSSLTSTSTGSSSLTSTSTGSSSSTSTAPQINYYDVSVINGTGDQEDVEEGTLVTVTADEAPTGKEFCGWQDEEGNIVSTDSTYQFAIQKDTTLTAVYELIDVTLTVNGGSGSGEYKYGDQVTIEADEPAEGKKFVGWKDGEGNTFSESSTHTFELTGDLSLTAEYATITLKLVVENGTGDGEYDYGSEVTIVADEPETGKRFDSWQDEEGNVVSETASYTFELKENTTLTAVYELLDVTLTVNGGTGSGEYKYGDQVTIEANKATEGKKFSCWKDQNDNVVSENSSYTFYLYNDRTLTAEYVDIMVTIAVNNGSGSGEYKYGDQVTVTADDILGKEFTSWMNESGEVLSREKEFTFTATEDLTLSAIHTSINYTVTVVGGSATGFGSFLYGQEVTVTAEEVTGKIFKEWVDESGEFVSNENPYTFEVTSNVSLTATYDDVVVSTFVKPQNYGEFVEDLAKASIAQEDTASMTYFNNNNNKYGSTDLNIAMYKDGLVAEGKGTTSTTSYASAYDMKHIYKLADGKFKEVKDFAYSSSSYDVATTLNVVETVEDESTQISQTKVNELTKNYGMFSDISTLLQNIPNDESTTFAVEELSDTAFKVTLTSAGDTSSTLHAVTKLSVTFNAPDYYITSVEYERKVYVISTQMVDGVLKEDATPRDTFTTNYTSTRLTTELENTPSDYDVTPYFISNYEFEGSYYEGSTSRKFNKDSNKIAIGAKISISNFKMTSGTIEPSTALEKTTLRFVSSSNPEVIDKISSTQIEAFKEGTATLTVESLSGVQKTLDIEVGVLPPKSLTINSESKVLINERIELTATPNPSTSSADVQWAVNDESLATIVEEDGKFYLEGKSSGYVTVTATSTGDSTVSTTKTIFVSAGELTQEQLKSMLVGTWYEKKSSYSDAGFTFEFKADGTVTLKDTYRSANKISFVGTWELTTLDDATLTHNGNNYQPIEDSYVIKITITEMTDTPAYYLDIHLVMAKDGSSLTYHFIPGSETANTQVGSLTKIS